MTQHIEDSFSATMKARAVFVDLTGAYGPVWYRGLTCKLLRLLHDRHVVRMVMELVDNRSFTLTTGNGKRSRLRRIRNGVPQGSVLEPLLYNIYISDLPTTVRRKHINADDLAIMHAAGDWQATEGVLSRKLTLSTTKTVFAVFHFINKEAKRELKVNYNNKTSPSAP